MGIIFTRPHCEKIYRGEKTQTRRLLKPGKPCAYKPGSEHAVQPGRGKFGVFWDPKYGQLICPANKDAFWDAFLDPTTIQLRVIIRAVWGEPLHAITDADAHAEGYASIADYAVAWDSFPRKAGERWTDNPTVWVIDFSRRTYSNESE